MPAVMVQLHGPNHTNLARIVSNHIVKGASFQVWVQVPVMSASLDKYEEIHGEQESKQNSWDWWNKFRLIANSNSKINLCLRIGEDLPSETEILRWIGEPMKTVSIATSMFLTNKKGYPVLSRQHQALIRRFIHLDIQVVAARVLN